MKKLGAAAAILLACALPLFAGTGTPPVLFGVRVEFILFGLTLLGVAVFHHKTFEVAVAGLAAVLAFKLLFTDFNLAHHLLQEGRLLLNLFGLLMGFAILARHFEKTRIPDILPHWLPDDWKGGFVLLAIVFGLAMFIDNIASAMLGGTIALAVYRRRIHIGFLVAVAAAANAGGAFSVIGSTPTSMMWIDGVPALAMLPAFVGSAAALAVFGTFASMQQQRYQPIARDASTRVRIDWGRMGIVVLIPALAVVTNVTMRMMALGVWIAILLGALFRPTDWGELRRSFKGSLFLVALVLNASMMPVETLPHPSALSTFAIGAVSAVFDNIPLTKLALDQDAYDWALVAYAISSGGSMIWFGSSAGVALCNMFPDARNVWQWVGKGWHVIVGYTCGFLAMLWLLGWHPLVHKHAVRPPHELEFNRPAEKQAITEPPSHPLPRP